MAQVDQFSTCNRENLGEVREKLSHPTVSALTATIQQTLDSIRNGTKQVESILTSIVEEIVRREQEHEELQKACVDAIEKVERLEREWKRAREQLMIVNRDINKYTEIDMRNAYDTAQNLQSTLAQWRERESQLRLRRDDVARLLKTLQANANRAESVLLQFNHITSYLEVDIDSVTSTLQLAHEQSLLGLQVLQIQEEEKRVFAHRLHDGPMQSLASIAMVMQIPDYQLGTQGHMTGIRTRINDILGDLRQVVFDLRPPLLDDLGLVPTLRRFTQQWELSNKIPVRVQLLGMEMPLSPTAKVTVFRCVQEALMNVLKHSQATEVELTLLYGPNSLRISVVDNGIGLLNVDWQNWLENGKLGLALCRQRLSLLAGTMKVEKRDPTGTHLTLELPIIRGSQCDTE